MATNRNSVFPKRMRDEAAQRKYLEEHIEAELLVVQAKIAAGEEEPPHIRVQFDRRSPEGIDRYTEYTLEAVVRKYEKAGWKKITVALEEGNTQITLWFL